MRTPCSGWLAKRWLPRSGATQGKPFGQN